MKGDPTIRLLAGFWLVAVATAFLPLEKLAFLSAVPSPPLFSSLSDRSAEPGHWLAYFGFMTIVSGATLLAACAAAASSMSAPKTKYVIPVALLAISTGALFLWLLLSIQVQPETQLLKYGGMTGSRFGLALQGSILLVALTTLAVYSFVPGAIAIRRRIVSGKAAP